MREYAGTVVSRDNESGIVKNALPLNALPRVYNLESGRDKGLLPQVHSCKNS